MLTAFDKKRFKPCGWGPKAAEEHARQRYHEGEPLILTKACGPDFKAVVVVKIPEFTDKTYGYGPERSAPNYCLIWKGVVTRDVPKQGILTHPYEVYTKHESNPHGSKVVREDRYHAVNTLMFKAKKVLQAAKDEVESCRHDVEYFRTVETAWNLVNES